jgi:transposase
MHDEQLTLPGIPARVASAGAARVDAPAAPAVRVRAVDRQQIVLTPVSVEHLIPNDHPARAIWAFVGDLDLSRFRAPIRAVAGRAGRPPYDPHLLVSLWVYSYSRGNTSAREIARRCGYDPAFQWLTGLQELSAHTLSDFRVDHGEALRDLMSQILGLLSAEGLITLERVMHDGTKIRACTSSGAFRTHARVDQRVAEARAVVEALEAMPEEEGRARQQRARERGARDRQRRLEAALQEFDKLAAAQSRMTRVSTTDPDARVMKQADGGTAPSYNVQITTDATECFIVAIEPTTAGSDYQQLTPAVDRVARDLNHLPQQMVVDGGFVSHRNIVVLADRGIDLIGPDPSTGGHTANRQKSFQYRSVHPDYHTSRFTYDAPTNTYVCPQGKRLAYDAKESKAGRIHYRYLATAADCHACPAKPVCCPRTRHGRSVQRSEPVPQVAAFCARMQTDEARAIYKTRSQVAEFPHLWIKEKLNLRRFRVRGLKSVTLECLWAALTYNIHHWIRLHRPAVQPCAA